MPRSFVPERGDVIWLGFFVPDAGREQAARRPALVLSPSSYNRKVGLAVCCPITSHAKGYPFEVAFPPGGNVRGVVLADHVKSLDWRIRRAELLSRAPAAVLAETVAKLNALINS